MSDAETWALLLAVLFVGFGAGTIVGALLARRR